MKKIGVMTSGGDSPGMNAAIRAVVRCGLYSGLEVYGIESGYAGMIDGRISLLAHSDVSNILSRGGTILRSARSLEFKTDAGQAKAVKNLKEHGIEALIVIGGDGSLTGAKLLQDKYGIKCIGIPGSIDNDLYGTDLSLGVDTALNVITSSIDMINNTASSHGRTFIIEVMGRNCGYLAVVAGIVTGADAVIIPEVPHDINEIGNMFINRYKEGKTRNILILSEGAGKAEDVALQLAECGDFDARITVLGHIQRGGTPTATDRMLGSQMGIAAVEALLEGKSGLMTGFKDNIIVLVDFDEVFSNKVTVNESICRLMKKLI